MHQGVTEATRAFYFTLPFVCSVKLSRLQIMKASLFAEDDDDSDMFHDHAAMKVSMDVSSPRLVLPAAQGRPSGMKRSLPHTMFLISLLTGFSKNGGDVIKLLSLCSRRSPSGSIHLGPLSAVRLSPPSPSSITAVSSQR